MEWLWTKMVIVLLGLHSMYHLLPHQHTPHLYKLGVQAAFHFSGLPKERYVQLGDINIGVLSLMTLPGKTPSGNIVCTRPGLETGEAEAVAFAVQEVNKGDLLPNNIKLGFVLLNTCSSTRINLASAVSFLPQTVCSKEKSNDGECQGIYDVVAVVGSSSSDLSISATRILSPAEIPLVSAYSTSDELSNTDRFPYFLRVVPPDRFQFKAIAELIKMFGWTYVSVLYQSDSYGENGFKMLRDFLDAFHICLATVHVLHGGTNEMQSIAKDLLEKHAKAPVVVLISIPFWLKRILAVTQRLSPKKTFVWIGTDGWSRYAPQYHSPRQLLDSLLLDLPYSGFSIFRNWFAKLTPSNTTSPWFQQQWENYFKCSFNKGTCNSSGHLPANTLSTHLEYVADAVLMIANATSRVLRSENCRGLTGSAARKCVTGPRLLRELKATQQEGYSGRLELDPQGDRYGVYDIGQLRLAPTGQYLTETVYTYNYRTHQLTQVTNVTWTNFKSPPLSYCSKPCAPHYDRIVGDVPCCWKCKRCEDNQYLVDDGRVCKRCPQLTWPDPSTNYSTCYRIKPITIRNTNGEGATVIILALIGLIVSAGAVLYFFIHRANPVIANGRALSFFMLLAITAGYLTIILFYITPSQNLCRITFLLYSTSLASIYGALFVRAIDVFRWYIRKPSSKEHSKTRTHFVYAGRVGLLQVVLSAIVSMFQPQRWHRFTQPYPKRPYVIHTCTMTHAALISFCVYSCLILFICIFLTFHTPSNAEKEDKLIFTCVCVILIIWLCFVLAYALAIEEIHRILFLVLFLFLNCSVVLLVVVLPKAKALWYRQSNVLVVSEQIAPALEKVSASEQSKISTCVTKLSATSIPDETQDSMTSLSSWSLSLNWNWLLYFTPQEESINIPDFI